MENLLIVPRDVLQRAYDELERLPDYADPESDTYILYHQIDSILRPDPAFITPFIPMRSNEQLIEESK